jgi:phosphoesterase RecJ-like protein
MSDLAKVVRQFRIKDNFVLVGHSIPDGDCIGSLIGLYLGLVSMGKTVRILQQEPVPPIYLYLNGSQAFELPEQFQGQVENVVYLDCSDEERNGDKIIPLLSSRNFTINIDHHHSNTRFGDVNYVEPTAASTAELIVSILLRLKVDVTPDIANALYAGIFQDTGGFQHNSTSGHTLRTAASLLDQGVNLDLLKMNLFESRSEPELKLLSLALQSLTVSKSGKIAWMRLQYDDVEAIGALNICPEGIVNYALSIKGVELALLFREISPGLIKTGFRSKGQVDVAKLAAEFGGGGHQRAAGASQMGQMKDVERLIIIAAESVV